MKFKKGDLFFYNNPWEGSYLLLVLSIDGDQICYADILYESGWRPPDSRISIDYTVICWFEEMFNKELNTRRRDEAIKEGLLYKTSEN